MHLSTQDVLPEVRRSRIGSKPTGDRRTPGPRLTEVHLVVGSRSLLNIGADCCPGTGPTSRRSQVSQEIPRAPVAAMFTRAPGRADPCVYAVRAGRAYCSPRCVCIQQLRYTPSGAASLNFKIAETPRTFDRQEQRVEGWRDAVHAAARPGATSPSASPRPRRRAPAWWSKAARRTQL